MPALLEERLARTPRLGLDLPALAGLARDPTAPVTGALGAARYSARVAIPGYGARLARHYGVDLPALGVPFDFPHFGVIIDFDAPAELAVYGDDRVLDEGLRGVIARYGPVVLRNAYLSGPKRAQGQRNIFPKLRFHVDRGATQPDRYSLFCRDPFDPVQRGPRGSSTLILANAAAYLQALKEGAGAHQLKGQYNLFAEQDLAPLLGSIILDQPWNAPEGTGEITILDNVTVLHASYYPRDEDKGYPIGVRYLF